MPHYKHFAMIVIVSVGGVVGELSACEGQLALLFATLCLVVAKLTTVSALSGVVLTTLSDMVAPPSS